MLKPKMILVLKFAVMKIYNNRVCQIRDSYLSINMHIYHLLGLATYDVVMHNVQLHNMLVSTYYYNAYVLTRTQIKYVYTID